MKTLDGLPLALATAGTYLSLETITVSKYLQRYYQSWADLQQTSPELLSYEDRTLYSTWNLSYDHIRQQDEAAAELLRLFAYFDNQDIWYELLAAKAGDRPIWLNQVTCSGLVFDAAMRKLCDHGLVHGIKDSGGYGMHNCVHSWTANALSEQSDSNWTIALCCMGSIVPITPSTGDSALKRRLLPHANRFLHRLLAKNCLETGSTELYVMDALNNLGILYLDLGKMTEAEALYQRALAGKEKAFGPDHTSTLDTVNNLGNLYSDLGKMTEAEALYQRALAGYEKAFGPDHTSTLDTVNNLGNLYRRQGKTREAEALYQRALAGYEKALGPDHTSTLDTVNNLGLLYSDLGKMTEAEALYQRALAGKEKVFGPDHTSTLNTVNNLGLLYSDLGKTTEAEALYQRALAGKEKALGPDHTSTLDTVYNLGNLYRQSNEHEKSVIHFALAWRGYAVVKGADDPETVDAQAQMERAMQCQSMVRSQVY